MTTTLERPTTPRGGLLGNRDFRLLWLGESTSALGSCVSFVAFPLVALTLLHAGVLTVSLLEAAAWLPWVLIGLPAGAWLDRMRRRPVMMACDAVSFGLYVSVPVAAACGVLTLTQLFVVAFVSGCAQVFFTTAYRAYLPAVVPADHLVEGNAKLQGTQSAAQVGGPGLGGLLAQAFGAASALAADAVSFVVSFVCLSRMKAVEEPVVKERRPLRADITEGLRFVVRDRLLRFTVGYGAIANLVLTGYNAIVVTFLVREIGFSAGGAGVLLAVTNVAGVAGAFVAPSLARRFGSARVLVWLRVGAAPFTLLMPLTGAGWAIVFFLVATMAIDASVVAGNVLSAGFMQAYCPPEIRARVSTCMAFVNFGAIPIGAALGGVLAGLLGFRTALLAVFALGFVNALRNLRSPLRGLRDLPGRPTTLAG